MSITETSAAVSGATHGIVFRNFMTLGAGEIASRLIGFLGTVWIARQLDTSGYGVAGTGFAVLLYFAAVADLGMEHLGPREVAEARVPVERLASSMILGRFLASMLIAGIMAAVGLAAIPGSQGAVLALFALAMLPMGASPRWVHLGLENARAVSASRLVAELTRVLLLLAFVHGPEHLLRVPIALVGGETAATLLLFTRLRARGVHIRPQIDLHIVRDIVRRGFPLLLTNLLALVIYNADIVLLRILRDESEVGLYLGAYTLINLLGVLGNTATLSLLPALSRMRAERARALALYHASAAQVLAVALPVTIGGAMLAPAIIDLVFGDSYAASAPVLRILILSIPVLLVRCVIQATLLAEGRQDRVLHSTTIAAIVTLGLNLVLIPPLGMTGAAITTVTAELARLAAVIAYSRAEGYTLPGPARAWRPALAVGVMAGVLMILPPAGLWLTVPAGAATYGLVLLAVGGFRRQAGRAA